MIYIEYLLIENFIINFIILYVVARITRTKIYKLRLFISSTIGTIYTLIVYYPSMEFMGKFLIKFAISILMVILAYNPEKLPQFIKQFSTFYLVSFIFAGAIMGIFYILNNNYYLIKFSFSNFIELSRYLIIGIIVAIILLFSILKYYQKRLSRENYLTSIAIGLKDKEVNFIALIDTGNSLKEPITQKPVIIAEYLAIEKILPHSIRDMYLNNKELDLNIIAKVMEEIGDDIKLRLIPFKSIGNDSGILIG
ncbi:MAG: sigma-E processing peptidase SpoIIGA, partial [Tissierellia bacterium]|nr:sigma-E processing peptidase SpoIIGA [Tissierellia bacterium]